MDSQIIILGAVVAVIVVGIAIGKIRRIIYLRNRKLEREHVKAEYLRIGKKLITKNGALIAYEEEYDAKILARRNQYEVFPYGTLYFLVNSPLSVDEKLIVDKFLPEWTEIFHQNDEDNYTVELRKESPASKAVKEKAENEAHRQIERISQACTPSAPMEQI